MQSANRSAVTLALLCSACSGHSASTSNQSVASKPVSTTHGKNANDPTRCQRWITRFKSERNTQLGRSTGALRE